MPNKYSEYAERVLAVAQYEAGQFGRLKIGTEHILLALVMEANGAASGILRHFGVQEGKVYGAVVDQIGAADYEGKLLLTPNATEALSLAFSEAAKAQGKRPLIDTEHLLLGLILQTDCSAIQVLKALRVDLVKLIAVAEWAASGIEGEIGAMVRIGQFEVAVKLLKREIDASEAVLDRKKALRDQVLSVAASRVA